MGANNMAGKTATLRSMGGDMFFPQAQGKEDTLRAPRATQQRPPQQDSDDYLMPSTGLPRQSTTRTVDGVEEDYLMPNQDAFDYRTNATESNSTKFEGDYDFPTQQKIRNASIVSLLVADDDMAMFSMEPVVPEEPKVFVEKEHGWGKTFGRSLKNIRKSVKHAFGGDLRQPAKSGKGDAGFGNRQFGMAGALARGVSNTDGAPNRGNSADYGELPQSRQVMDLAKELNAAKLAQEGIVGDSILGKLMSSVPREASSTSINSISSSAGATTNTFGVSLTKAGSPSKATLSEGEGGLAQRRRSSMGPAGEGMERTAIAVSAL